MADDKIKDRIDLKLYNTIIIYDVYTVARTPEAAREGLLSAIAAAQLQPTESVAREVTMANSIRQSWVEQSPWMGPDITDEEFETLKGTTTGEMRLRLYTKAPKK